MDDVSGSDLLVDDAALAAAVHRIAPLVEEVDAVLTEVDAIICDLRRDCAGHHTGAAFDSAQTTSARVTETELRVVRAAVLAFTDKLSRTSTEFVDSDADVAAGLGTGQC